MRYSRQQDMKIDLEKAINKSDLDGHLAIDIKKEISPKAEDIKCFGVKNKGSRSSGKGIPATKIINKGNKKRLLFSISKLIKKSQFSDKTEELVIKDEGREVCRKKIDNPPCSYF